MNFRTCKIVIYCLFLILLGSNYLLAQVDDEFNKILQQKFDPLKEKSGDIFEDENLYIPPLRLLIDTALVKSPLLEQQYSNIAIKNIEILRAKTKWTDHISPYGSFTYGTSAMSVYSDIGEIDNTAQASERYNLGISVQFSFFDLIDRRNEIAIASHELEVEKKNQEIIQRDIRIMITQLYNNLILAQRLLAIKSESQQAQSLNYTYAEKQFLEGEIKLPEYTKIIETIAKSSADFEEAKVNFSNAYMMLEEYVGMRISEINKVSK